MRLIINATLSATIDIVEAPPSAVTNLKGTTHMSTVTLTWTDPTTRTDGSALAATDISNVEVFDSAASDPSVPIGTVLGGVGTFTTGTLTVGVHSFTIKITDTTGHVSAVSNPFTATIAATLAPPSAVTNLAGTVNP